ncbi:putative Thermolysin [metagenome]|uniref:Putative Thermolysin n=1 Tax=metagenome TaxID=256318 RepID=A0A2P2BYB6_9ZZZZ
MGQRARRVIGSITAGALLGAGLVGGSSSADTARPADPRSVAAAALAADASAGLRIERDAHGVSTYAGVAGRARVDNPAVTPSTSVSAAADAHLRRYGAAFGTTGSTLTAVRTTHTVSGQDVVRYRQSVAGLPVIGGDLVVTLRPDRELGSLLASLSARPLVAAATVGADSAADAARRAVAKSEGLAAATLHVTDQGRRVFDPEVLGVPSSVGARTVWQFEVGRGEGLRRLVLVDDQTGGIRLNLDDLQSADRVVCNRNNVRGARTACTSGFARTETSPASGVTEVDTAFTLAGVVSDYYDQIGDLDLTGLLGVSVGGVDKLASTVKFCHTDVTTSCPLDNAFWDGTQMFYGDGYAGADDVVGHEMTHGVIDHFSELFYAGQSGAVNESIADIMGEIVDHRNPSAGDAAGDWRLGEDLPIGAIRDLADPPAFDQPDTMTSNLYTADSFYGDIGGVHTNSGVGNKTAYLISQGGTFNGQTVAGIDTDAGLTKTATLYLDVLQRLGTGSDYADLARVLDQSCQDLVTAGRAGFTADDCTDVHAATLATELRTTPTNAPQPADARATCPSGTSKRVLFNSESGTPAAKFVEGDTWTRAPDGVAGPNATSGRTSWFSYEPTFTHVSPMVLKTGLRLPAGQRSYLRFQQWRALDYDPLPVYYDGGTVELDDVATAAGPAATARLAWVNGPTQPIEAHADRLGFGGDSFGWIASRLNLTSYAGKTVKPRFTMRTDNSVSYYGWFLDDIRIYTCDLPKVSNTKRPTISGTAAVGRKLTAKPGTWQPDGVSFSYRWLRNGKKIKAATAKAYQLKAADRGKRISVKVTAAKAGYRSASATSAKTPRVR